MVTLAEAQNATRQHLGGLRLATTSKSGSFWM